MVLCHGSCGTYYVGRPQVRYAIHAFSANKFLKGTDAISDIHFITVHASKGQGTIEPESTVLEFEPASSN